MTTAKPGRKGPDVLRHEQLTNTTLLISVALKKNWPGARPAYWLEIYARKDPTKSRFFRFFLYGQWSFVRTGNQELIEGSRLHAALLTTIDQTATMLGEAFYRLLDKSWVLAHIEVYPEGEELERKVRPMIDGILQEKEMVVQRVEDQPKQSKKKEEDFWTAAREREKKAKW